MDGSASLAGPGPGLDAFVRAGLIDEKGTRTRVGDEFRIAASRLATAVARAIELGEPHANLVMVTSTRPEEGKSFSALNLAATLAQVAPRPVLLVDVDAKPGCLSDLLGVARRPGLADLGADPSVPPSRYMLLAPVQDLAVLPLGTPEASARPRTTLAGTVGRLAAAMPETTVVLDAGPLLATSEPSILAPAVGTIVFVVEAGRTQRPELDAALDLARGCPRIVLLLNKAAPTRRAAFGAYSYYGAYHLPTVPKS